MRIRALLVVLSVAATLCFVIPDWAQLPSSPAVDSAVLERGKQIFTSHCGKCHDANAAKVLPDGTTLLARLAANKDPNARLATRLKSMPEQDGRAVVLYVDDLIARFQAAQNGNKSR
jgi:mono/diheme cytochrome c family protein